MRHTFWIASCVVLIAGACGTKDNSAPTDKASKDLRQAETAATDRRNDLTAGAGDVERRKRALVADQQQLADQEAAVALKGKQLGSAETAVVTAAATYRAAVSERLAKVDAAVASLATNVDATSRDAVVGIRARRDRLAAMLAAAPPTDDAGWATYTKTVDTTFDGIERDLHLAEK